MSLDFHLVETIKTQFCRKSSAQLQAILQPADSQRWSPEAVAAAAQLLEDRQVGRAPEPPTAEEETAPPPYHYEPEDIALVLLGGLLTRYLIIPYYRTVEKPDLPLPFGPRAAWLALETTDTAAVTNALDLEDVRDCSWAEGVHAAYQAMVFVTPPLGDWTVAVSTALFPPARVEAFVRPLLERLSRQFGEVHYFGTQQDVDLQAWARARKGQVTRGYAWLGQKGLTLWNEGTLTKEESLLGLEFLNANAICERPSQFSKKAGNENIRVGKGRPVRDQQGDGGPRVNWLRADEDSVMALASLWSIDPTSLDEHYKEPAIGQIGRAPWRPAELPQEPDRGDVGSFRSSRPR
jgi:hypothetical protein